ncbi:MAG: hypothetical protein SGPRY_014773, partial [Prymnesium sp.]
KEITKAVVFINERLGIQTGLGYPSSDEITAHLVRSSLNEGAVMAALKKANRVDVEMMRDISVAAEVDEILTPE